MIPLLIGITAGLFLLILISIHMTATEVIAALGTISTSFQKGIAEVKASIADLKTNGHIPDEAAATLQGQLDGLAAAAAELDNVTPDAPSEPTE